MRVLQSDNIIDLFVLVDDTLPKRLASRVGGRPTKLSNSEVVTLLLFNSLTAHQRLLKDIYKWSLTNYTGYFNFPSYSNFVDACHRALPDLVYILQMTLNSDDNLRFMDSTMLPVCRLIRSKLHKVAREVAAYGKNWQGWHYGFKLHASCDRTGKLAAICFTPANVHDSTQILSLINSGVDAAVGDTGYYSSKVQEQAMNQYGTLIITPPHPSQKKKISTEWQLLLLKLRPKIETVFDYLKEHMNLVTSFPRSVGGYFLHYIRTILGYQLRGYGV